MFSSTKDFYFKGDHFFFHFKIFPFLKEQKIKDDSLIRPEENAEQAITEKLMETAFGLETLGLPLQGLESNASNITSEIVTKFYLENFSFDKIFICASGVKNHEDFVKLVENNVDKIVVGKSSQKRKPSVYKGGVNKIHLDRDEFHAALIFQSVNMNKI